MYQTQWFANKNVFKWLEVGPMGRDSKISNKTKKKKKHCMDNILTWKLYFEFGKMRGDNSWNKSFENNELILNGKILSRSRILPVV